MIQSFEILFAAKFFRDHVIQIYIVYIHHVSSSGHLNKELSKINSGNLKSYQIQIAVSVNIFITYFTSTECANDDFEKKSDLDTSDA